MTVARFVHYHASGTGGLAFACYLDELVARLDCRRLGVRALPAPRRSTDLAKVTCPDCWARIAGMARASVTP